MSRSKATTTRNATSASARKLAKILQTPETISCGTLSTQNVAGGDPKYKSTKANTQDYGNLCVTNNQIVADELQQTSVRDHVTMRMQNTTNSSTIITDATNSVGITHGLLLSRTASEIPTEQTGKRAKLDVNQSTTWAQAHAAKTPVVFLRCEAGLVKTPITSRAHVTEAAIRSHSSGKKATYIQPMQPNTPEKYVQAPHRNRGSLIDFRAAISVNVKPTTEFQVLAVDPGALAAPRESLKKTGSNTMRDVSSRYDLDQLFSNDEVEEFKTTVRGKSPASRNTSASEQIGNLASGKDINVLPATDTSMTTLQGQISAFGSLASEVSQHVSSNFQCANVTSTIPRSSVGNESQGNSVPGAPTEETVGHNIPSAHHFAHGKDFDSEEVEVRLAYGSTRIIRMTKEDMGKHIPVWNRKQKYKLAGTSAPLGKNLSAYLQKKKGEYELYTDQDQRHARERQSARITLWNKRELRKISGTSAPLKKNIEKYLKEHPECEIYNGQAERLDPSAKRLAHNRVILWNKLTHRRTGFGSSGPLRKNLSSYLRRNPHLEEYIGQDKTFEQATGIMRDDKVETESSSSNSRTMAEHTNRWHPGSHCEKKSCQYSSGEKKMAENLDCWFDLAADDLNLTSRRHCLLDLADLPDLKDFHTTLSAGRAEPKEWYESFYISKEPEERVSVHIPEPEKENLRSANNPSQRTYRDPKEINEENRMDIDGWEHVKAEPTEQEIQPQVDTFLDLDIARVPIGSVFFPHNGGTDTSTEGLLNLELDMNEDIIFPSGSRGTLGSTLEEETRERPY